MTIFDEPTVIMSKERGLAGTGMTEPRALQIESDLADLLARAVIDTLSDVPDVNTTGLADGYTLIWDDATSTWLVGVPPNNSVLVADAIVGGTTVNAESLLFLGGLDVDDSLDPVAIITPVYAGTGVANTIARSDHTHTETFKRRKEWTYGAVVSSGTPTLDTFATQTLAVGIVYDIDVDVVVDAYGSGGAASSARIIIEIDGVATTGTAKVYEAGVNGDKHLSAVATITGAGGTKNIVTKMQFVSGAGPNVIGGYTKYAAGPRR